MTSFVLPSSDWLQIGVFFAVLFTCAGPLGAHMAKVYNGEKTFLTPVLGWLERLLYKLAGIDPHHDMEWHEYAKTLVFFSCLGFLVLFALLKLQGLYGPPVSGALAFNIAVSFVTNTNWQSYVPEKTLIPVVQMTGLAVENFFSPAVGLAVMAALVRGFTRARTGSIGNFWADFVRSLLYLLLPLALVLAIALVSQGVIQNMATDPVASQIAIKQLGSNGGGYFNANAAHPFENPTPLSNFLEILAILLIPAAQCVMFGRMVRSPGQGRVLIAAMMLIFLPMMLFMAAQEQAGNPQLAALGVDQTAGPLQAGGNMEGKETRFGILNSALWAGATTASGNGSTNAALDSFTPLGGMVPLLFIQFGDVIFGGVGSGLYSMLLFVIVTVFLAGLMVGRTPEYLGKKIQTFEMKMAALAVLAPHLAVLIGTAVAVSLTTGKSGIFNPGPQGFTEILYAFTSASNNNGSAMAGLAANTPFYNVTLGIAMLIGRYMIMLPVLAMAGSLAQKSTVPSTAGTLPTATPLFAVLLAGVVVMVGVLTFIPTLALGPLAAYFDLTAL